MKSTAQKEDEVIAIVRNIKAKMEECTRQYHALYRKHHPIRYALYRITRPVELLWHRLIDPKQPFPEMRKPPYFTGVTG